MRDDGIAEGPTALATTPDSSGDSGDERLEAGALAGEYEIVEHLGAGAMGDVYEGKHPVVDKRVAVKVIKRKLAGSAEAVERFVREAKAVNRVDHPAVLDVFSFGRLDDGRLYLVMDLLSGESLGERIRRDGAMPVSELLAVLEPVCGALQAAHDRDVVHRDLKPDNVFVTDTDDVYVLDFGIAKMLTDVAAEAGVQTLTGEGVWLGTPADMAPEQWTSDGASAASDIYALGAMCFEMLTGRVPYRARSVPAMMEKHFHADIPPLTTSAGVAMPAALDDVIHRAMAKTPEDRFGSPAELLDALRAACDGSATAVGARGHAIDADGDHRVGPGRAAYVAGGVAVVLMAAAAVALFVMRGSATDSSDDPVEPARPSIAGADVSIDIRSTPDGARIYRGDDYLGMTPHNLIVVDGTDVELRMSKPGYAEVTRAIVASKGAVLTASLPAVAGFEGQWELADGKFRSFERRGDRVVGYLHEAATSEPQFLRFFEFTPTEGASVSFGAASEHVDERAPNEPSCRMDLRAEYRYTPATDALELREQRMGSDLKDGRCVVYSKEWKPFETITRLSSSFEGPTRWATSSAGASGNTAAPDIGDIAADQPAVAADRKAASNPPVNKNTKKKKINKKPPAEQPQREQPDLDSAGVSEPPQDDNQAAQPPAQKQAPPAEPEPIQKKSKKKKNEL
jgi:serine/threonine-protein kinase